MVKNPKNYPLSNKEKYLDYAERQALRQERALPLLKEYKEWLDDTLQRVPPQSPLSKAYLHSFDDIPKKIDYILQAGFFRITQYFYYFTFQGIREDTGYVSKTYFPSQSFRKKQDIEQYLLQ